MFSFDGLDQQKKAIRHQPANHIKDISSNPEVFYTMDPRLECRPWHVQWELPWSRFGGEMACSITKEDVVLEKLIEII